MTLIAAMVLFSVSATRLMAGVPEESLTARSRFLMGAPLAITVAGTVDENCFTMAFDEVARLEAVMSNWRDDSEISGLNRAAGTAGGGVACSPDLFHAIDAALHWAERSDGAFDPTVEPLVRDLGLRGADGRIAGADDAWDAGGRTAAGAQRAPIGWRNVVLDRQRRTVRFAAAGVAIDLGGIGKGIALDAAARILREAGVQAALLDFGGQVLAFGPDRGGPEWKVAIADPDDRDLAATAILIHKGSLATSGNSERGGARREGPIGHILDPASGRPASFTGTVTVVADTATAADALSTALYVMGPEHGSRWAEGRGIAALFLWKDARGTAFVRETSRFRSRFAGRRSTGPNG